MKRISLSLLLILNVALNYAQSLENLNANRVLLPNGWSLTPAGESLPLGDLPLNIAVSNNQKLLAVTNNGQSRQSLQLIDPKKFIVLDDITIAKSWYGLKFSKNGKYLFAAAGNDNQILRYAISNNKLVTPDTLYLSRNKKENISPAGFDIDEAAGKLFVVTKENNSLYILNMKTKKVETILPLESEAYTCLLSADKQSLYISLWGAKKLAAYSIPQKKIITTINVGDHPNELLLSKNGKIVYVANANDNSVSVIDVAQQKVIETLNAALYPDAPSGSTTNGLALSKNQKTLYIANADNNCLAVFNVREPGNSLSKGFIPTGWYPTNVKLVGKDILVSNGKGFKSLPNPHGPNPLANKQTVTRHQGDLQKKEEVQYIGGLFKGTLSKIKQPSRKQLGIYSAAVHNNTPYTKEREMNALGEPGNPIPMKVSAPSPIKYVFYIIKENRTFDQVLSDVPGANGDTTLLLFGEKYTPNQHALVKQFVLMDNFYCDAEVSADGHDWSLGAYATDYLEKTWPTSYGGRGGSYDGEGFRPIANNKGGFIWDNCKRNNISYRTYGEFAGVNKPNIAILKNHICPNYDWSLKVRDTTKFRLWQKDFDSLLVNNALTQLNTIRFGNDHTEGMSVGRPTPYAHVADNDLAVGLFVEHLSKSPIWNESVVLIVEDDAQNGADHVDAHRSTAYLAGPFVKRGFIDHTMYSTSSILRTIELILGLPPMTQYDAAAPSLWRSFTSTPNFSTYSHIPSNVNLNDKNTALSAAAKQSALFDFSKEDNIADHLFNEVLWQGLKGKSAPSATHAAFIHVDRKKEKDED
ncbi:bifunctional YncE family protein/alkaline phosphatase family protein [Solitalea koreensis]|uniref:40-residue YVTN family beta-propeller repeat-containing protein n=1 Tax=Solitalea koreensis TaxID=543615 RepID=A0A521C379_9SPHI|nr:bifunctional YncE family protein/alkaline phosphatase family protein [Solitalea koreensis]SMO53795.1 40-residue YVTN family beta-propeller repeat-containing protein [Solitalea koreensis]